MYKYLSLNSAIWLHNEFKYFLGNQATISAWLSTIYAQNMSMYIYNITIYSKTQFQLSRIRKSSFAIVFARDGDASLTNL